MNISQGIGFSKNTGSWPMPENDNGAIVILDENNNHRTLVLNNIKFYDVSTRNGPASSSMSKVWNDLASGSYSGEEIPFRVTFKEDRGTLEHYFLNHLGGHFYVRPEEEANRDQTGFDSDGYQDDLELSVELFKDGEQSSHAVSRDIIKTGEVVIDDDFEANRIQVALSGNRNQLQVIGRNQYYKVMDKPVTPNERPNTEASHQTALAGLYAWYTRGGTPTMDRVSGELLTADISVVEGLDGRLDSAMRFNTFPATFDIQGAGTVMFWSTAADIAILVDSTLISDSDYTKTYNGWYLYKADISSGSILEIDISTGSSISIYDLRFCNSIISDEAIEAYYRNIVKTNGDEYLPM